MNESKFLLKKYTICLLVSLFIISSVAAYTELGSVMKIIKNILEVLIILITLPKIDLSKYKWIVPLFILLIIYPLIMIGLGIYNLYPMQNLMYVFMTLFNLMFYISMTTLYFNKFDLFMSIWQNSLFIILMILLFLYKGISLNISYMIHSTIINNRYGSNLLVQRYGMGFNNVNQLALFSSILFICSVYFLYRKRKVVFSVFCLILSFIFICNSESRAPFVAIFVALIFLLLSIKNCFISKIIKLVIFLCIITFGILFSYFSFKMPDLSAIYQGLNTISSMRLYFSSEALAFVQLISSKWIGIGPISTTFVTQKIFGETLTLDSSLGYCLFSFGIIGTIGIFLVIFYLIFKNRNNKFMFLIVFFITYAMFENAIFIPNSLLSCFGCIILFIFMRSKNESK